MYTVLVTSLLAVLTAASPVQKRAGGPVGQPIPSECTIANPGTELAAGTHKVAANFKNTNQVYSYYLPMDEQFRSHEEELQNCLEQCYGYGEDGDCVAVYLAYDVPLPEDYPYGTPGNPSFGCQFFSTSLAGANFVDAASAHYTDGQARNINCPAN